ncbi:hypothetical protein [Streptobacillus moniliformis]|uniref:hypothetical protein n=1 Tax=Streptobacillus moniliformis TaxID=34105 RepID=UPI0007E2FF72|nr:hypothetical protein [Streptobacillus moniliformis]
MKPKISTEFSYVEGRLKVSPWIGAEFNLENKPNGAANNGTTENKDFVLRKIVGKGGIETNQLLKMKFFFIIILIFEKNMS